MRNDISITDRIGNGIVAGFIATFVMSALHEPVALLTAAVGMRAPVGLLFHFFVGTLLWGGAFGLAHGKILVLFPEGERSIDGTVKKFKKGAPILAQHLRVPIVPVAIKGVFELWPRGRSFNWRLLRLWSRHRVRIVIGEPMMFVESADYNQSATELRDRVDKMWQALG